MTSTRAAQRLGRSAGALAVCSTAALAALTLLGTEPGHRLVGVAIAATLLWSCAPLALVLLTPRRAPLVADADESPRHPTEDADPTTGFTTFVRLGDEPPAIARSSVALARRMGPTVIVTRDREIPEELHLEADAVHSADTIEQAVLEAAASVDTDAVLIVSARAVPQAAACARAAQLLDDRTGWVVGTSRPFNDDRYASDRREVVGAALRRCAVRAGVDLWENDATLIRSDLLAEHPLEIGRPWGAWLRERRAEGLRGAEVDDALSLRAAPVAAGSYWPDALARQRAVAADAGSAARQRGARARIVAALLVARELYAYPLAVWLLAPVLMSEGFAFRMDPWVLSALLGTAAVLRWWSLRALLQLETLPRADLISAVYHAPGSLAALVPALLGRLGSRRRTTPTRPLVWAALVLTIVAAYGLLRHEPGESPSRVAVAASLAMLLALWAFTVRSLVERNWSRSSYRVPMTLEATVAGVASSTVDGSPGGLAARGRFPAGAFGAGTEVDVEVHLDDGIVFSSPAVIAARRRSRGRDLLGLELHPGPDALDDWTAQLLRAAEAPGGGHLRSVSHERTTGGDRAGVVVDRAVLGAVVVISLAVIVALGLVLLGFRPFVVRSGSMVPTYDVGDIVIVEQVPADQLRPGDVASLEYYPDFGESMTHRVRAVRPVDGAVQVETRGDANDQSEVWAVAPDALVGRVVASVPAIGAPATLVRTNRGPLLAGLAALALAVGAVLWGHRLRAPARTRASVPADEQSSVSDQEQVRPSS